MGKVRMGEKEEEGRGRKSKEEIKGVVGWH